MLRRLSGVALGLAAAATAGALAPIPTFRSGVDLFTIDVTAIDPPSANHGGRRGLDGLVVPIASAGRAHRGAQVVPVDWNLFEGEEWKHSRWIWSYQIQKKRQDLFNCPYIVRFWVGRKADNHDAKPLYSGLD